MFEGHPNKNNMLGLSQMLKVYGMDMIGVRFLTEKEDVELPIPCIVHINGEFVVATKLAGNTYIVKFYSDDYCFWAEIN